MDTTTLDGWYVETYICGGKKLNFETIYISGNTIKGWYIYPETEANLDTLAFEDDWFDGIDTIDINNLSFSDDYGDEWEMTTENFVFLIQNINNKYFVWSTNIATLEATKTGNTFSFDDSGYSGDITTTATGATVENSTVSSHPQNGDYTHYTRSTPWPTVTPPAN